MPKVRQSWSLSAKLDKLHKTLPDRLKEEFRMTFQQEIDRSVRTAHSIRSIDSFMQRLKEFRDRNLANLRGDPRDLLDQIFKECQVVQIQRIAKDGFLDVFLTVDNVSLAWMFEDVRQSTSKAYMRAEILKWEKQALNCKNALYLVTYRFWDLFQEHELQGRLPVWIASRIAFVAMVYGDDARAMKVAQYAYGKVQLLPKDSKRTQFGKLKYKFEVALIWGIAGQGPVKNTFEKAEQTLEELDKLISSFPGRQLEEAEEDVEHMRASIIREKLRAVLRTSWRDIVVLTDPGEWRSKSAEITGLLNELEQRESHLRLPIDFDTLARAHAFKYIFENGWSRRAPLPRANDYLNKAYKLLNQDRELEGGYHATAFTEDCLRATGVLIALASGSKDEAQKLLDDMLDKRSIETRAHTKGMVLALQELSERF